jgi:uncharacterized lipoprotein YddW (UPF0748 family)
LVHLWLVSCVHSPELPPVSVTPPPVPAPPAPPPPDLVDVAAPREFRGLWVATVSNLDFPSRAGLSPDEARAELATLVSTARARGLNALVFQVRPEADALYASTLEPWSRFLTGHQGEDPGFDPLAELVALAHPAGLEVHAWFNPYRAAVSQRSRRCDGHVTATNPTGVCKTGTQLWLDPGDPALRAHTLAVVDDVLGRYAIDGIHLDDYFYPYPTGSEQFPDAARFAAYTRAGGTLDRDAWRRSNVDALVEGLAAHVRDLRPDCRFGISPFGIYRPGIPAGIRGMDQVAKLHADPLHWYREGWVDYLAPQLYWTTGKAGQPFGTLVQWWGEQATSQSAMFVGLDATKVGREPTWTLDELRAQVTLAREAHTAGQIWFRAAPVLQNQAGLGDLLAELYASPALPPASPRATTAPEPPTVESSEGGVTFVAEGARGFGLYQGEPLALVRLVSPDETSVALAPGTWVVSAVGPGAAESRGLRFTVPAQ